jgi:predicted enzyme related to lactoylglutathione lyase
MTMRIVLASIALAAALLASAGGNAKAGAPQPILASEKRFEQVAITTTNLAQSMEFYRDRIGLPLLFESNGMAFFDVGGVRLMVAFDKERAAAPRPQAILYFHVDDFDRSVARLKASTIKLVGPVETVQSTSAGDLKLQQFEDPDGNALAIMGVVPRD